MRAVLEGEVRAAVDALDGQRADDERRPESLERGDLARRLERRRGDLERDAARGEAGDGDGAGEHAAALQRPQLRRALARARVGVLVVDHCGLRRLRRRRRGAVEDEALVDGAGRLDRAALHEGHQVHREAVGPARRLAF